MGIDDPAGFICRKSPDAYKGYTITEARIETPLSVKTPLSFFFGAQGRLQEEFASVRKQLPLKEGMPFDRALHSASIKKLFELYGEIILLPGERLRATYITYSLEGCDENARTMKVVYRIYSSDFFYYISRVFEMRSDKITRSLAPGRIAAAGAIAAATNKILPQPFMGYNRSRGVFAGTRASFKSEGGIFDRVDMDVSASGNSATAGVNLFGSKGFNTGWLSYLDWRLGYRYFNLPSDSVDLKASTVVMQLFGASQPIGCLNTVFRFGASIEGGNRQADLANDLDLSPTLAGAPHRAAKIYTGVTFNYGRQAWAASYGLQIGSNDSSFGADYLKHVVDTNYDGRFLWREHRPLRVELQFTAGAIQSTSGSVPLVERFFGGNEQLNFIEGGDWVIHSSPLIRSFPQNRLNRVGPDAPIGGKNFFSFNATLTQPLWNRPAVPDEISRDSGARGAIGAGLQTAYKVTFDSYVIEEPQYKQTYESLLAKLSGLAATVETLPKKLEDLRSQAMPQGVLDKIEQIGDDPVLKIDLLEDSQEKIEQAKSSKDQFRSGVRTLVVGFSETRPALITRLAADLGELGEALRRANLGADAVQFETAAKKLLQFQTEMLPMFNSLLFFGQITVADLQAARAVLKNGAGDEDVERVLQRMGRIVGEIKQQLGAGAPLSDSISLLETQIDGAKKYLADATADPAASSLEDIQNSIDLLMVGFGELVLAAATKIVTEIKRLQQPLAVADFSAQAQELAKEADKLANYRTEVRKRLQTVRRTKVELKARRDIDFAARSLETVFRELNLIALSPAVMFDAARIGPPANNNQGGVRYGLGAGMRFSLVTLDVTTGYSWNLNPRPGEGRGAFVFSMNISDLFR